MQPATSTGRWVRVEGVGRWRGLSRRCRNDERSPHAIANGTDAVLELSPERFGNGGLVDVAGASSSPAVYEARDYYRTTSTRNPLYFAGAPGRAGGAPFGLPVGLNVTARTWSTCVCSLRRTWLADM